MLRSLKPVFSSDSPRATLALLIRWLNQSTALCLCYQSYGAAGLGKDRLLRFLQLLRKSYEKNKEFENAVRGEKRTWNLLLNVNVEAGHFAFDGVLGFYVAEWAVLACALDDEAAAF